MIDPKQQAQLLYALKTLQDYIEKQPVQKSCQSCLNYKFPHCTLANQVPPADIVQNGCPKWDFDCVPF